MSDRDARKRGYDYNEDAPPSDVIKAMTQIAIYAATYGDQSYMYLHDPVVRKPILLVQEYLKAYGFEFDDWQFAHAPAPEPEPPDPPDDWDEENDDNKPHYDTPGGW